MEDVGLGQELRERAPLDQLLAQEPVIRAAQVDVVLVRPPALRPEHDELGIDAAVAESAHRRPAGTGKVQRAMNDSEGHRAILATPPRRPGGTSAFRRNPSTGPLRGRALRA
jgi:hypothetical protein